MPEFGLAGAEIMCETLAYNLHNSGIYNVIVVSLYDYRSPITERLENFGIKVLYLGKKQGLDLVTIGKLIKIMRLYNIKIVHTHRYVMQYAIPAAIIARVPVRVHTVHNIANKEVDKSRRKMAKVFYKFFHVKPVSISPIITDTISAEYNLNASEIPMVFNGTNLKKCLVKTTYDAGTVFQFIHIGRMSYQKNHELILRVAAKLKESGISFIINLVGGGEKEFEIKNLVKSLKIEDCINFCGLQSNVYSFLNQSDCFILPSRYEGMPVTLVEAMGCAMPIIASAVGGVPDMIEDEVSGLLIKPTEDALYNAMLKMISSQKSYRESLGYNALLKSKEFSDTNMTKGYMSIYDEQLKKWN